LSRKEVSEFEETSIALAQVWPNLGLHLATLAKIAALLEQNQEAASHAKAAALILRITHPDGQALQEMLQLWHDANAELSANAEE